MAEPIVLTVITDDKTNFDAIQQRLKGLNATVERTGGLWRDQNGYLRNAQGQFASAAEKAKYFGTTVDGANRSFGGFVGLLKSSPVVAGAAAVGIGVLTNNLTQAADASLRAADRINAVHRGLEIVYGSTEAASIRFSELNELAKLPGLDPEPLARYDAMFKNLGNTAKDNDIIFTGTAKAVTSFGGNVHSVTSALLQLSQGFAKNKIDAQDIKSIIEQTGGTFITTAQDVLGFTGGIEGLRTAFNNSGKTLREFLLPVFEELNTRFDGAPVDSYTNRIDNLGVAFFNLQAEIGELMQPACQ